MPCLPCKLAWQLPVLGETRFQHPWAVQHHCCSLKLVRRTYVFLQASCHQAKIHSHNHPMANAAGLQMHHSLWRKSGARSVRNTVHNVRYASC